jgi:type I restriction enzyme S subunit
VLRPKRVEYAGLTYLAATASDNIERLAHLADGAAYPAVGPDVIAATTVICADDRVLNHFHRVVSTALGRIANNERESRTLAAVRDTLLPKLISSEQRVPAAFASADAAP